MDIKRNGTRQATRGAEEYFTGPVVIESLFQAQGASRAVGAVVRFEPGARTAWHTHPLGQTLIISDVNGWVQREGGPVEVVNVGDVVTFSPGEKHWHGATATESMTHIAIQEHVNGVTAEWMEKVSDEQYQAPSR
jgi:quercetin dioxygenase-like cupin family protein